MRVFKTSILLALFSSVQFGFAQQLPLSSQYYQNMLTINPAYTGFDEYTTISASHRSMLTGLQGSPQTNYISVAGQGAEGKMGLGLVAFQDRTDIFSLTSAMVNYVYKARLGEMSSLNLGVGVGVQNFSVDLDKAQVNDVMDPVLFGSQRQNRIGLNGEFGAVLQIKGFQLGVAVPQLFASDPAIVSNTGATLNYNTVRHLRASVKYDFMLNEKRTAKFYPLFVVRQVNGAPIQWDANGVFDFKNIGWIGITYHSTYAVSVSAGLRYRGFSVGYAHDFPSGVVNDFSKRSSELILSYQIGNTSKKDDELKLKIEKLEKDIDNIEDWNDEQDESIEELETQKTELEEKVKELQEALEKETADRKAAEKKMATNTSTGNNNGGNSIGNTNQGTNSSGGTYRSASASNFVYENGQKARRGYYVVIGSFSVKENAIKWKKKSIRKGNDNTIILYDAQQRMHQVCVYYSENKDPAMADKQRRSLKQRAWVLGLD